MGLLKIVICTTPIRPVPTDYPPFGSMAVIQSLRKDGWDPYFYDIDGLRPDFDEVERFFAKEQPDVVGISAVVSTAYAYTKKLVRMIHRVAPEAKIVIGGNLAASAEILHRLAGVDYCVVGEGEIVVRRLMNYLKDHRGRAKDETALNAIAGLTFLDAAGEMVFTGYEAPIPADELFEPDYTILEKYSKIGNFVNDPMSRPDFAGDPRSHEPHRKGMKMATLITTKGCVARCTFCHRWDKGFRAFNIPNFIKMVRYLKEKYNVGFLQLSDENFGSDRRQLLEFTEAMKAEDVLYQVGGVRVRSVNPDILRRLKESGCVAVYYGMETGSPEILDMMEKKAGLADNLNAARWTKDAGLYTIYQMILGMPGETAKTIGDTIDFLKKTTEYLDDSPINRMSINYIQALPGTPVYEYARLKGLIGSTMADEERYLLHISDINAGDETKFINFTGDDYLTVQSWRRRIILEVVHHYRQANNIPNPRLRDLFRETVLRRLWPDRYAEPAAKEYATGGYFNLQRDRNYHIISAYFYPIRGLFIWFWLLKKEYARLPWSEFSSHLAETLRARLRPAPAPIDYKSLRKIVQECQPKPLTPSEKSMAALRDGR
jgi:radical SAM superfamily enzyme YgiQ (UPF0313 family)